VADLMILRFQVKKNKLQVARKFKNIYRKESREALRFKPSLAEYARQTLTEISDKVSISSTFFMRFFVRKSFLAAFSSYVLSLAKNLYKKLARKMLMKSTFFKVTQMSISQTFYEQLLR